MDPRVLGAERSLEGGHLEVAASALAALIADPALDVDDRALSLAMCAELQLKRGGEAAFDAAQELLAQADALGATAPLARGRLAHVTGMLAYKRGEDHRTWRALREALEHYPEDDRHHAHVLDTLGAHFVDLGDLRRARQVLEKSLAIKQATMASDPAERVGVAIAHGSLGRLALAEEDHDEAIRRFEEGLRLVSEDRGTPARVVAQRHNFLGVAFLRAGRLAEARAALARARDGAGEDRRLLAYCLKDLASLALAEGRLDEATAHVEAALRLATEPGHRLIEVELQARTVEGQIWTARAHTAGDASFVRARDALHAAIDGLLAQHMPREASDAQVALAELLRSVGEHAQAVRLLSQEALPLAERHLFHHRHLLDRIEAALERLDESELLRIRLRRVRGANLYMDAARLDRFLKRVTVWTCDIRGFTRYCEEATDEVEVADMLDRLFESIGTIIQQHDGTIDKYVGDNILAYFPGPDGARQAVGVGLAAQDAMDRLNADRKLVGERELHVGIGIATGKVVLGNLGWSGKLEHTIIGRPVNLACRLVGEAAAREILVDAETAHHLAGDIRVEPTPPLELKGIGSVTAYRVLG